MSLGSTVQKLNGKRVLVTGGAGFIGSNLVGFLLENGISVRVLDNLETGKESNIAEYQGASNFEFFQGDIRSVDDCMNVCRDVDVISHQAALGSVPRSIEFPQNTHAVNATGFLNMLHAAKESGIKRFVFASSSSVYGDSIVSPKTIGSEGNLLSPYAVTKALNEEYSKVYHLLHGMETVGLRYFNVFGPKQDPLGVYAAAIPKFLDAMKNGGTITIHGDGEQTRDFTYVENAVKANVLALTSSNELSFGSVFNVACGEKFSLNQVIAAIQASMQNIGVYNQSCQVKYGPERKGDIRNSLADISLTTEILDYKDVIKFSEGMDGYLATQFKL